MTATPAIPVTILTGFLGAGKTTVLNRILSGHHGLRIAALVNDFGSINIDADLVVDVDSNGGVISLANGCVCCNIRDDLLAAVDSVIERDPRPDYIVLEASGIADPSGLVMTFANAGLRESIRLDSIVCVMDASAVFDNPELMNLKLRQIAYSDLLVLNKTDLVDSAEIGRIREWLDGHFARYRLVEAVRGDIPLSVLLAEGRLAPTASHADADAHAPAESFSSWSYESDQPFSLEALREAAKRLPAGIYRCKGTVHTVESPSQRSVLHVVGKRVDLQHDGDWGNRLPHTKIVVIAASGTLHEAGLRGTFDRCIASR